MFERFTDGTRAVVVEAHDLALELGSDSIGAGHLLYGCAESREETAGGPLNACGITPAAIRRLLPRVDLQPTGTSMPSRCAPSESNTRRCAPRSRRRSVLER